MKKFAIIILIGVALNGCTNSQSLEQKLLKHITLVVSKDGTGTVATVQEAIDMVPENNTERFVIFIRNGEYKEKIVLPRAKTNVTMIGESAEGVILTYDDYSGKVVEGDTITTYTSHSFAADADDFVAMNITFANSAGPVGQAVAIRTTGDRQIFYNCRFIGHQDTYYTQGHYRNYLKNCFIEGTTDYIFGRSTVVFDSCHINSLKTGSYITAASTEQDVKFGYVFFNCRFTAAPGIERVSHGRPWRPFARTVIINSFLDGFVNPEGWSIWRGRENHHDCYYAEYQNYGPGADISNRIHWSHQLTEAEREVYTIQNIFAKSTSPEYFEDDWIPNLEADPIYSILISNLN
ncbi:pectinesterase family protein [Perlabentimonas gracilis]|uniref:pectinesterase family protein n=1 Tax=Perlabentimonas gracilis TaxID=2715279 RepID=UPI00140B1540|nr:pectinesterase family protein [Perlabentimonas gracilis]NHB68623.1 pectin esterase [Perlabentimonas gracilis]